MTSWPDLPPEILNKIAGKLEFYEDLINFLCVCSSWRSSATTTKTSIHHLPSRFPLLMLAESTIEDDEEQNCPRFLLSMGGTMRKVHLPEAHRQRCISAHGWLMTTGGAKFHAQLLHPLSRARIDLPELYMFEELEYDQDEWMFYGHSMRKAVFTSSNPLSDPSFRVIIIWGQTLGFCRVGDDFWTRINGGRGRLFDISYHTMRKRLYAIATNGTIYECDILKESCPLTLSPTSTFPGKEFGCLSFTSAYLLEWSYNGLLMVARERCYYNKHDPDHYSRYGSYRTNKFRCFLLGLDDGRWSEVVTLGVKAVFLGFNSSFAVNAAGSGGVTGDCIYFTDDLYEPHRDLPDGGGGDVGVYHMSDGRIEGIFHSQDSIFRGNPPLWLQATAMPLIKEI